MSFSSLGLAPGLNRALSELGYDTPTPVQAQAIPLALEGRDLLAGAQTGTGKTAAFALPMLHRLALGEARRGPRQPRALILTPTRELALQVHESIRDYGKHLRLFATAIYGGAGMRPQVEALRRGVDIIVATAPRCCWATSHRKCCTVSPALNSSTSSGRMDDLRHSRF
jgi:ATP-dependent RNA helicase RhlE